MQLNTHLSIDTSLSGKLTKLEQDYAEVTLHTTHAMRADTQGLVHGGFIFSAADFAAMSAINDPHVVLGAAEVKFLAPVKVGDRVLFEASAIAYQGKKRIVEVVGFVEGKLVFEGSFMTFVLDKHILET